MRRAIGVLGITLPLILVAGSSLFGTCSEVQYSISTYYHTNMRNVFVGYNCAAALFLFAYRGHDWRDNLAGYLGCIFVLGVAFLPSSISATSPPCLIQPSAQNPMAPVSQPVCTPVFHHPDHIRLLPFSRKHIWTW